MNARSSLLPEPTACEGCGAGFIDYAPQCRWCKRLRNLSGAELIDVTTIDSPGVEFVELPTLADRQYAAARRAFEQSIADRMPQAGTERR